MISRKPLYIFATATLLVPFFSLSASNTARCPVSGYTVATINGVFNDELGAQKNLEALVHLSPYNYHGEKIDYQYLLNPSHLGGLGDLAMAAYQKYLDDETVQDYDLIEMLKSASQKIATRKLLLVAHSQGNFYANSFYDTITGPGWQVPKSAIGVYAVATPASRVAGGGEWITSDTDKVIAGLAARLPGRAIMKPNTSIKLSADDDQTGHGFADVYLKYRGAEIVSGIETALGRLKAADSLASDAGAGATNGPCIAPPILTAAHRLEGVALAAADPVANLGVSAVAGVGQVAAAAVGGAYAASVGAARAAASVASAVSSGIQSLASGLASGSASTPLGTSASTPLGTSASEVPAAAPETQNILTHRKVEPSTTQSPPDVQAPAPAPAPALAPPSVPPPAPSKAEAPLTPAPSATEVPVPAATPADPDIPYYVATPIPDSHPIPSGGGGSVADLSPAPTVPVISDATTTNLTSTSTDTTATSTDQVIVSPPPDTTPPTISLAVSGCQNSISSASCLIMSTTTSASWSSPDSDLAYYILNLNGFVSTTTATSANILILNDSSYTIAVSAVDTSGNQSATSSQTIYASQTPIVINELAWGGTIASASDEWIELYNRSAQSVNLSGFTLYSKTDMSPYINLSGTVPSHGYFLIESNKNIPADLFAGFGAGLSNSGENIVLAYTSTSLSAGASSTIDEIPYCFNWCGVPSSRTTERYDPDSPGNSSSNWSANTGTIINGTDTAGNLIYGTPKARNSVNYLISKGGTIFSDLTLKKVNSPYLVDNTTQSVSQGVTLTIEPGVVIKFRGAARLSADGNIVALGTASDPIVFTAFADDSYGGDMDGVAVTPVKGSWFGVELSNKSTGSSFINNIFRYGGNYGQGLYRKAMLYAIGVSPTVASSTFEYSKAYGTYLDGSNSIVSNSIFRNNIGDVSFSSGLYINQGSTTVSGNSFTGNGIGLQMNSAQGMVANNSFSGNTSAAYLAGPLIPFLAGNSGSSTDTISLAGAITTTGATTTLYASPMPYFLSGTVSVVANSVLNILEGTVIKNTINGSASLLSVSGKLNIDTSTTTGVIFSSTLATPTKGFWSGIIMNAGSTSHINGATIRDAVTGIQYNNASPIYLNNVTFSANTTAVKAISGSPILKAANVIFNSNGTDKNPSNLW